MGSNTGAVAVIAAVSPTVDRAEPPFSTQRIFETIMALGGIQAAAMVFTLVRGKTVALTLGTVGVGATSLVDQFVVLLAQLTAFSLPLAGVKFLSAADSESREEFERLYRGFFQGLLLLSLAGTGVALLLLFWRPGILSVELSRYRAATVLALLSIPAVNLTVLLTNTMASARRAHAAGLYNLATTAALAICCAVGVFVGGLQGYYAANLAAIIAMVMAGALFVARRKGVSLRGAVANPFQEFRRNSKIFRFSALMYLTSFTSPLSDLLVRYAVLSVGGLSATGLFQSAAGIGFILRTVLRPSFGLFLTPALTRRGAPADKLREAAAFTRVLCALIGMGAVPLVLFPKWWLLLLYSRQFETAAPAIYLFVMGIAVQLLGAVNIILLLGVDDTSAFVQATILSDIATAVFAWWLAPRMGLAGVGLAFLVDGATTFTLTTCWLWSRHRLMPLRAMGWLPASVMGAIGAAGMLANHWPAATPGAIACKTGLYAIFALCLLRAAAGRDWRSVFSPTLKGGS